MGIKFTSPRLNVMEIEETTFSHTRDIFFPKLCKENPFVRFSKKALLTEKSARCGRIGGWIRLHWRSEQQRFLKRPSIKKNLSSQHHNTLPRDTDLSSVSNHNGCRIKRGHIPHSREWLFKWFSPQAHLFQRLSFLQFDEKWVQGPENCTLVTDKENV